MNQNDGPMQFPEGPSRLFVTVMERRDEGQAQSPLGWACG